MTDRYFPHTVPTASELSMIILVRYVVSDNTTEEEEGAFHEVKTVNWPAQKPAEDPILIPTKYVRHLRHFLWRHHAFMEVYDRGRRQYIKVAPALSRLLQKYIVYMDGIAEGLLTTARHNQDNPTYRSRLFDLYLVVEYFVARHEYDIVGDWRYNNPKTILECQDPFSLGKCLPVYTHSLD